ncbi:hypothetical protein MED222_05495 [Vibrio sp. MED222]|nr:hypothetical protein MED222_05495 [Vibrio sp. MED222]
MTFFDVYLKNSSVVVSGNLHSFTSNTVPSFVNITLKYLSVVVAQWINTCWTWPLLSMEFAF